MSKHNIEALAKLAYTVVTTNPQTPICMSKEIEDGEMFQEFKKEMEKLTDADNTNDVRTFYSPKVKCAVTINNIALCNLEEILKTEHVALIGDEEVETGGASRQ